tara:strand:+ start:381 stop:554 length:174 start_codon:yes stop_codon:yes gene_type:complete
MAKDVHMKKGKSEITISQDFVEHYTNMGYTVQGKNKNISVAKETEKIIKDLTKEKKE